MPNTLTHPERSKEAVGRRLRAVRAALDLQARELCELITVATNTYSQWENGRSMADLGAMTRLWDKTGVDLNFIFLGQTTTLPFDLAQKLRAAVERIEAEPVRVKFARTHAKRSERKKNDASDDGAAVKR